MNTKRHLKLINIALICILPLFAACEEEEDQFCNFIDLATSLCLNKVIEGAITGTLPTTGGGGSSSGGTSNQTAINVRSFDEYEPNNTLDNANPVYFPPTGGSTREGIKVLGVVRDIDDVSDFFVFTPTRTSDYSISVSSGNCSCAAIANGRYLMVYDQSQTTVASTAIGTDETLALKTKLNAGVAYYVEVNGTDTLGVHFVYELFIQESD
jgi:hypothetical protein